MAANFPFPSINHLLNELRNLISMSAKNTAFATSVGGQQALDQMNHPKAADAFKQANQGVDFVGRQTSNLLGELRSPHINEATKRLLFWLKTNPQQWSELNIRARALRDIVETELKERLYYQYPLAKSHKLRAYKIEWHKSLAAFPAIDDDVFLATDCYACGHDAAAVFHCMGVLEAGIRALAADVQIKFDTQQWYNVLNDIEGAIKEIQKRGIPGLDKATKDDRLQFLSEAAKEFFYFKDGWRNYVSHGRVRYDEHQALGILEHTRAFMNHLALRLSEAPS